MKTVKELRLYMRDAKLSPEDFAREIKISNMTIRRILGKKDSSLIPEKYLVHLEAHHAKRSFGKPSQPEIGIDWKITLNTLFDPRKDNNFKQLLSQLEDSGRKVEDYKALERKTRKKLLDPNLGALIKDQAKAILKGVFLKDLPLRHRAMCAGAILYFINPMDLIPDTIPVVGYLDDFAVMSLVAGVIAKYHLQKKKR